MTPTISGGSGRKPGRPDPPGNGRGEAPVRILVSACLLGEKVRYDGGHKRNAFVARTLGRFATLVPVCPEVECGLGVPREPMRLEGDPEAPRLVGAGSGFDRTGGMARWIRGKLRELEPLDLCGYVCKEGSPSSGMARVEVFGEDGTVSRSGSGLFTKAFMDRFPLVPVEEAGRLADPLLREMFVARVFTLRRFRDVVRRGKRRGGLVDFHTDHKMLLLSRGRRLYAEMGKLVAASGDLPGDALFSRYGELLTKALSHPTSEGRCADVLLHMAGHLKGILSAGEKRELLGRIARYRGRLVPLGVPVAFLRRCARKYGVPYLERQVFLEPYPAALSLRNRA